MKPSTFTFKGENSSKYGIKIIKYDVLLPPKRKRKIKIPRRDGSYDYGAEHYDDRIIQIDCIVEKKITRTEMREISYWLSGKGQLVLWDEDDKYYIGEIYESDIFRTLPTEIKREFTINFECEPYAYSEYKIIPLNEGYNSINYNGTAKTPTRIRLVNNSNNPSRVFISVSRRR